MRSDARLGQRLGAALIFVALSAALAVVRLLPIDTQPMPLPGPDLMLCLVLAWTIRRPDLLPVWLVAVVMLAADLLLMRPPGLWAALVVLATEWLRQRDRRLRGMGFGVEMLLVGVILTLIVVADWAVLAVLMVPLVPLPRQLLLVPVTLAAYPVVALACRQVLGLRRRPAVEGFGRGARA